MGDRAQAAKLVAGVEPEGWVVSCWFMKRGEHLHCEEGVDVDYTRS